MRVKNSTVSSAIEASPTHTSPPSQPSALTISARGHTSSVTPVVIIEAAPATRRTTQPPPDSSGSKRTKRHHGSNGSGDSGKSTTAMRKASSSAGGARGGSGKGGGSGIDDNCDSGNIGRSGPLEACRSSLQGSKENGFTRQPFWMSSLVPSKKLNDTSGSTRHSIMEYILANYDTRHPNYTIYFARTVRDAVSAKKPRTAYTNKNGSWIALARSRAAIAYKVAQALEKIDNQAVAMMTRAEAKTKARARTRTRAPAKFLAVRVTRNRGHSREKK
ncbi:hypothetical protein DFQ27_008943 [Actinomortierella ambigua]|uniref:Uncharacterized protein n=1 Tax=Actinomortierella ambigua TaxID=1343610 RepID=A0A9P6QF71_9FUNG|nr:hypothetical protein DFQ27_008943 [Actinomortierella ambigua]